MDGKYQNEQSNILKRINSWIDETIQNSLWENYWDLHITEVSTIFKSKETWIEGSLYIRSLLLNNDKIKYYDLLLAIPLGYNEISGKYPLTADDLTRALYSTPPSFYFFPKESTDIRETLVGSIELKELSQLFNCIVQYKETYDQENDEYYRIAFFI